VEKNRGTASGMMAEVERGETQTEIQGGKREGVKGRRLPQGEKDGRPRWWLARAKGNERQVYSGDLDANVPRHCSI